MAARTVIIESSRKPPPAGARAVELAYLAPMGLFLILTGVGVWFERLYAPAYIARALAVAALLFYFRRRYTPIQWTNLRWGALVGIIGIVQWIGMEKLLPNYPKLGGGDPFDPTHAFSSPAIMWSFITIRWASAALLVPVMEELFWRDYCWRMIAAPDHFLRAPVGIKNWKSILLVPLLFATVHPQWLTAIVWALLIAALLIKTRSLGACIIAHAVTNFLLGAYVLYHAFILHRPEWRFW